jgi:hypothetical protein
LLRNAFTDDKADNCPISAIDEHIVDYAEQSSALRDHLVTNDVRTYVAGYRVQPRLASQIPAQSLHLARSNSTADAGIIRPLPAGSDKCFACTTTKPATRSPSRCTMISLIFPEPLRGFHVDDSTSD